MRKIIIFLIVISIPIKLFCIELNNILNQKITLNLEEVSLTDALVQIYKLTDLPVVVNNITIPKETVSIHAINQNVQDVLDDLLSPFGLTFSPEVISSLVRLKIVKTINSSTISGRIVDQSTINPLELVNVYLDKTNIGTTTNVIGHFKIENIPKEIYTFSIRMIGYENIDISYNLKSGKEIKIDFYLKPKLVLLEQIDVIGERENVIYKPQISKYTFSSRQLSKSPSLGEYDVFLAIQKLPGIVKTNEYKSQLYIRGGNSDQNLILLDGGVLYNPFHFSGIFSAFDTDAIDQVNLFTGGFPAEYGGRLSSVMDIRTKKGSNRLSIKSSFSPLNMKGLVEGPFGTWGNYLISGRLSYGMMLLSNTISRKMGRFVEPSYYDCIGNLELRPTKNDRIKISGFYGYDEVKESGRLLYNPLMTSKNSLANFNYQRIFSNKMYASMQFSLGEFSNQLPVFYIAQDGWNTYWVPNSLSDQTTNIKVEYIPTKNFEFKLGASSRKIEIKYLTPDVILSVLNIDKILYENSIFMQQQFMWKEKLVLGSGIYCNCER